MENNAFLCNQYRFIFYKINVQMVSRFLIKNIFTSICHCIERILTVLAFPSCSKLKQFLVL
jgi:hypothetical protein